MIIYHGIKEGVPKFESLFSLYIPFKSKKSHVLGSIY